MIVLLFKKNLQNINVYNIYYIHLYFGVKFTDIGGAMKISNIMIVLSVREMPSEIFSLCINKLQV